MIRNIAVSRIHAGHLVTIVRYDEENDTFFVREAIPGDDIYGVAASNAEVDQSIEVLDRGVVLRLHDTSSSNPGRALEELERELRAIQAGFEAELALMMSDLIAEQVIIHRESRN